MNYKNISKILIAIIAVTIIGFALTHNVYADTPTPAEENNTYTVKFIGVVKNSDLKLEIKQLEKVANSLQIQSNLIFSSQNQFMKDDKFYKLSSSEIFEDENLTKKLEPGSEIKIEKDTTFYISIEKLYTVKFIGVVKNSDLKLEIKHLKTTANSIQPNLISSDLKQFHTARNNKVYKLSSSKIFEDENLTKKLEPGSEIKIEKDTTFFYIPIAELCTVKFRIGNKTQAVQVCKGTKFKDAVINLNKTYPDFLNVISDDNLRHSTEIWKALTLFGKDVPGEITQDITVNLNTRNIHKVEFKVSESIKSPHKLDTKTLENTDLAVNSEKYDDTLQILVTNKGTILNSALEKYSKLKKDTIYKIYGQSFKLKDWNVCSISNNKHRIEPIFTKIFKVTMDFEDQSLTPTSSDVEEKTLLDVAIKSCKKDIIKQIRSESYHGPYKIKNNEIYLNDDQSLMTWRFFNSNLDEINNCNEVICDTIIKPVLNFKPSYFLRYIGIDKNSNEKLDTQNGSTHLSGSLVEVKPITSEPFLIGESYYKYISTKWFEDENFTKEVELGSKIKLKQNTYLYAPTENLPSFTVTFQIDDKTQNVLIYKEAKFETALRKLIDTHPDFLDNINDVNIRESIDIWKTLDDKDAPSQITQNITVKATLSDQKIYLSFKNRTPLNLEGPLKSLSDNICGIYPDFDLKYSFSLLNVQDFLINEIARYGYSKMEDCNDKYNIIFTDEEGHTFVLNLSQNDNSIFEKTPEDDITLYFSISSPKIFIYFENKTQLDSDGPLELLSDDICGFCPEYSYSDKGAFSLRCVKDFLTSQTFHGFSASDDRSNEYNLILTDEERNKFVLNLSQDDNSIFEKDPQTNITLYFSLDNLKHKVNIWGIHDNQSLALKDPFETNDNQILDEKNLIFDKNIKFSHAKDEYALAYPIIWYSDANCTKPWDKNSKILGDVNLYTKLNKILKIFTPVRKPILTPPNPTTKQNPILATIENPPFSVRKPNPIKNPPVKTPDPIENPTPTGNLTPRKNIIDPYKNSTPYRNFNTSDKANNADSIYILFVSILVFALCFSTNKRYNL